MPLKYVYGQDHLVADFVARSKLASGFSEWGSGFADKNLKAIGIANDDNELIAGIVFFNYHPEAETIEMSVEALPKQRWLTPTTLKVMFQYPFLQCRCQALFTKTSARNKHVLRMLAAMNFDLILIPRAGGRNEDGVVAELTIEHWIASKFCKRFRHDVIAYMEQQAA
jgi:hypothetical protein